MKKIVDLTSYFIAFKKPAKYNSVYRKNIQTQQRSTQGPLFVTEDGGCDTFLSID